mmetsp:Transcript_40080/g.100295  ORF Transcript_40080/g.100295 Transcript_40080/m.100295 type:complete len:280 (+) Transcript_40080:1104-1943(+)
MMSVQTSLRNCRAWETMMHVLGHSLRYCVSHATACRSRWFVGSSSSKRSGSPKRALASATRILQPPENSLVFLCCMSVVKPSPSRMVDALLSALCASMSLSRWYIHARRRPNSSVCSLPSKSFSSCSRSALSTSTAKTASRAVSSPPRISCSIWRMCMSGLMPCISPRARALRKVDLPIPLRPTKPYLRPIASFNGASRNSSRPAMMTEKDSTLMSVILASCLSPCRHVGGGGGCLDFSHCFMSLACLSLSLCSAFCFCTDSSMCSPVLKLTDPFLRPR